MSYNHELQKTSNSSQAFKLVLRWSFKNKDMVLLQINDISVI